MAVGSYLGQVFTVSNRKILSPGNLKGSTGGDWVSHERIGGKAKSEFSGARLRSYSMELLLRAQDGVNPRETLNVFQKAAEQGTVDYFILGNAPLSEHPFRLTEVGEEWNTILGGGQLMECRVNLTIEEYL